MTSAKLSPRVPFYNSKGVTLYCARFEQILPELASDTFGALITDPPYAITNLAWDKPVDWPMFWNDAHRVCRPNAPMIFFASGKFVPAMINSNPKHYRYDLVWEKNMPVGHLDANRRPLRSHESILIFSKLYKGSTYNPQKIIGKPHTIGKGTRAQHYGMSSGKTVPRQTNLYHPRSVLRFNNSRNGRSLHPTQKPLDLMKWLVLTYSDRKDTILEPFAGSGSTVVAAAEHGRKIIAIEQSLEYCEVIAKRLEKGS
jgi:DNA modification methylase